MFICLIVYNIRSFAELFTSFVLRIHYKAENNMYICFALFASDLSGNGVWCRRRNGSNASNGNDKWHGTKSAPYFPTQRSWSRSKCLSRDLVMDKCFYWVFPTSALHSLVTTKTNCNYDPHRLAYIDCGIDYCCETVNIM